jgi:hypothetical protein
VYSSGVTPVAVTRTSTLSFAGFLLLPLAAPMLTARSVTVGAPQGCVGVGRPKAAGRIGRRITLPRCVTNVTDQKKCLGHCFPERITASRGTNVGSAQTRQ